jgi:arylsulfatase A-like enzyme
MIILLYVMDSLRYDFLSCYGYPKETSPNIDRLAEEGVMFTHAFAQSTWTRPSAASILSSTYPSVHGVFTVEDHLRRSVPLFPEELRKAGFETVAVSSLGNISPDFGFGRGFDHFIELYKDQGLLEKRQRLRIGDGENDYGAHFKVNNEYVPIATSEDIHQSLIPFLRESGGSNLFCLAWSMDTHNPYFQRDPAMARFHPPSTEILWSKDIQAMRSPEEISRLKAYYEEMIYYNDYHLGLLVKRLKDLDLYDETLFIVTGDHGEAFGERGHNSHSGVPFDEQIRVPLIMKFPHSEFSGRVPGLVQHIDIAPTILEYLGIKNSPTFFQGTSLIPLVREKIKVNDYVFSEYHLKTKLPRFVSLRTTDHKYIEMKAGKFTLRESGREITQRLIWFVRKPRMLFSFREDPGEKLNLARKETGMARVFHGKVEEFNRRNRDLSRQFREEKKDGGPVDKSVAQQLRALGYFD